MLQPLQLEEVLTQCPAEIVELRNFLLKAGLSLDTEDALPGLCSRIQNDRAFRRDLTSHIWVIAQAGGRPVGLSDLLGILTIAAAGAHLATAANDTDAHGLLRFLMEARRSFADTSSSSPDISVRPPAPRAVPLAAGPLFHTWDDAPLLPARRSIIGIAIIACLLVALCLTLWLRHSSATGSPVVSSPPTQPAPALIPPVPTAHTAATNSAPDHGAASAHAVAAEGSSVARSSNPAGVTTAVHKPGPLVAATPAHIVPAPPVLGSARTAAQPSTSANATAAREYNAARHTAAPTGSAANVPGVQAVELGTAADGGHPAGTAATHVATVRPTSLGIMAANVTYSPAPPYPPAASEAHVQGEVKVEAEVGPDGSVSSARVISGPPLLRDAAVSAIEQWRYRPYVADGKPITVSALIVMDFQLH